MKLHFYINSVSNGGAERVMCNLATEMSERGHDCTLTTTFRSAWEYETGKKVKRFSLFQERPKSFFLRNVGTIFKLRALLKKSKPDLLVTFMCEPNFRGIVATRGLPVKSVISVRNAPEFEYGNSLLRFLAKTWFRLAHFTIFQTSEAQCWFPLSIRKKSAIIFNPVAKIFYETPRRSAPQGIVTMGRLTAQKNHALLIRAFAKIADKIPDDLSIYGNGNSEPLKVLAKAVGVGARVRFPGRSSDVPEILSGARLFVLSSDFEGMPNALMEAMAVGVPCISTDCPCGGPKMLFPKTAGQFLVPVNDDAILAEKMLQVLTNSETEKRLADECKKAAAAFESSKIFNAWEQCFLACLDKK